MSINLPTKPKTADERLEALARSASNVTLLKYNSGNWTISDIPVPTDTRFVLYPDQVSHHWTNFAGGRVVTEISAVVADDVHGDDRDFVDRQLQEQEARGVHLISAVRQRRL